MAIAPYGTWTSPLSARVIATGSLRIGGITLDEGEIYWIEGRPSDGGRNVLVRRDANGHSGDLTPPDVNVRTRLHEYGGPAYIVSKGDAFYVNFADQRIYRLAQFTHPEPNNAATPMTPPGFFYGDFTLDPRRQRLICVREDHTVPNVEPVNTLVSLLMDGSSSAGEVLASGYDFYSTPCVSPDGSTLAWLSWRHPQMPWDGTELWIAPIGDDGSLGEPNLVAGSAEESIYQPGWGPDGALYFVSDKTGWWSLYRFSGSIQPVLHYPVEHAEFGRPQWIFGTATWAFAGPSRMVVSYTRDGRWHLATIDVATGTLTDIAPDVQPLDWLTASDTYAFFVAGSLTAPDALVGLELATGATETIRISASLSLDPGYVSIPEAIEFPTTDGLSAHAFYYPPRNKDFSPLPGDHPPLIVISHGGPTTAARATLDLQVQYWTSRGFAVADVNYGGSSGYGREYRQRLNGQWGIVDVDDVVNAARWLSGGGPSRGGPSRGGPSGPPKADAARLAIRGGSAGGYTTLAALTFHAGVFGAGASYYGVSDIEVLARDTHKFESRYLDTLIGPYPEMRDLYRARSPIHFVNRLACPLILFQGLDDKVVPPNQSHMMADAVRAKGLPVEYLTFEGEQHGFRKAETIVRCLEAELSFYRTVFALTS